LLVKAAAFSAGAAGTTALVTASAAFAGRLVLAATTAVATALAFAPAAIAAVFVGASLGRTSAILGRAKREQGRLDRVALAGEGGKTGFANLRFARTAADFLRLGPEGEAVRRLAGGGFIVKVPPRPPVQAVTGAQFGRLPGAPAGFAPGGPSTSVASRMLAEASPQAAAAIEQVRLRLAGKEAQARIVGVRAELAETIRLFRIREDEEDKSFRRQIQQAEFLADLTIVGIQQAAANRDKAQRQEGAERAAADRNREEQDRRRSRASLIERARGELAQEQSLLNRMAARATVFRGGAGGIFARFRLPAAQSVGADPGKRVEKLLREQRDLQKQTNRLLGDFAVVG
jgi:hypothetical protein